jgi:pimeloyl-ACP methyl ester carboxylesterase
VTYVDVRDARIRYHESGDPSAPPVVQLHGIGRSLEDWLPQHPLLATDHRVISVDMPGFGLSQRLRPPVTLGSLSDGVWQTLDALGETRPVHLMGNSLGGAVAMQMLVDDPARVSTLTLANSAGFGREVTFALRVLSVPGLGRRLLARIDPRTARRVERTLFVDGSLVTEERVRMAVEIAQQPDFAAVYVEIARALGSFWGVAPRWRSELLTRVRQTPKPTLVVWGDHDLILPAVHLSAARDALPHARTYLFPETGHMPQVERPEAFAELVRQIVSTDVEPGTQAAELGSAGLPPRPLQ